MNQRNKGMNSFLSSWIPKIISFILALLIFIAVKYMNMADRVITVKNGAVQSMTVNPDPTPVERIEW